MSVMLATDRFRGLWSRQRNGACLGLAKPWPQSRPVRFILGQTRTLRAFPLPPAAPDAPPDARGLLAAARHTKRTGAGTMPPLPRQPTRHGCSTAQLILRRHASVCGAQVVAAAGPPA